MAVKKIISGEAQKVAHCITFSGDLIKGMGKITIASKWIGGDGQPLSVEEVDVKSFGEVMPLFEESNQLRFLLGKLCETVWNPPTPPEPIEAPSILDIIGRA